MGKISEWVNDWECLVGMGCEVTSAPPLNSELQLSWHFGASHRLLFSWNVSAHHKPLLHISQDPSGMAEVIYDLNDLVSREMTEK